MKKLISFSLIVIILLLSVNCITAYAASGNIAVGNVSGTRGSEIDVEISIISNPGIVALRAFVEYDHSALKLKSVTDGNLIGVGKSIFNDDLSAEKYTMLWIDSLAQSNYTATGVLVTLTFEILETAKNGDYSIKLSYDPDSTFNYIPQNVTFTTSNGKVTVKDNIIPVESISLDKTNINIGYKQTDKITATVLPDNATNKEIVWSSSNESIVTVDQNGNIVARKTGTAKIIVTLADETQSEEPIVAECTVNVSYLWWQWIIRILLLGFLWY